MALKYPFSPREEDFKRIPMAVKITRIPIIVMIALLPLDLMAQYKYYQFNSKAMGFPSLDYSATEIKRTEKTSTLLIPGFHARTAPGARWMMCAYNELAKKRGFQYWVVAYPEGPSQEVLVGFAASPDENITVTLGSAFGGADTFPVMAVERIESVCREMLNRQ